MASPRTLLLLAALLAVGCGDGDQDDSAGMGITVANGTVRLHCGRGDCSASVIADVGGFLVGVGRATGGQLTTVSRIVPEFTNVDIETGDGNDTVQIIDTIVPGTLRIATGAGDDHLDLCDVGAGGDTRIGTGAGNDVVSLAVRTYARRFKLDLGDGDDEFDVDGSDFRGEISLDGGPGDDGLILAASVVARAERVAGFERCSSGSCPSPE